jgi:hypothetical protein
MSGGRFDYQQYRLHDIAETIEEEIESNTTKPSDWDWWGQEWTGQIYSDEVIDKFKEAVAYLKVAECYAQRVDWLLSGDDGEESMLRRLKTDLEKLAKEDSSGYVAKILENKI